MAKVDYNKDQVHHEMDVFVRPSPFFLYLRILTVHSILLIGILLAIFMPRVFVDTAQDIEILYNFRIVFILALVFVGEIANLVILARWISEFYVIKNESLTYRIGIFFKQKRVLLMRQIVEVILIQSFFGKLFNYGTLKVISSQSLEEVYVRRVENPNKYFKLLRELCLKQQVVNKDNRPMPSFEVANREF